MDEILTPNQWYELRSRIQQQYPELTDEDLQYHEAIEKDMLNMVEYLLQRARQMMKGINAGLNRDFPLKYYWRYSRRNRIIHLENTD